MRMGLVGVLFAGLAVETPFVWAQEGAAQGADASAAAPVGRVAEAPVEGLVRRDSDTVALGVGWWGEGGGVAAA